MLHLAVGDSIGSSSCSPTPSWAGRGRPQPLEQVLLNLVLNARDAMPAGGRLLIETSRAVLDAGFAERHRRQRRPARRLRLLVGERHRPRHGPGTLAQVFEPFFTTKPFGRGHGPRPLDRVRHRAAERAGSSGPTASRAGHVFKVYLPEATAADEVVAPSARTVARGDGRTILVVDDAEQVRSTTARALRQSGYRCIGVANAAEALEVLRPGGEPVDLVVTDVVMPGMNGRVLADRLRDLRPDLPVVFVSGYTEEDIVRRGLLEEGRPFLPKPFTPDEIVAAVGEALDARTMPA